MKQENRRAVEKYLSDEIRFEELRERVGQEDAETVQESKKQLMQAENLAEELSKL